MRAKGRILSILLTLGFHTSYIIYYLLTDHGVEIGDWLGYPIFFALAYWAGLQFDNAKFHSEMDILTNLYNRRFMMENFNLITDSTKKQGSKLFILVIDCDNFKHVNDSLGHSIGDKVLHLIGKTLKDNSRKTDVIARWGGDEFIIVGKLEDHKNLSFMMSRLSEEVKKISDEVHFPISISIGSSVYPDDNNELNTLLKIADDHMYEDKLSKKIRLVSAME
jgi:diguanylate cyclase (GGDEF)-like protein